MGSERRFVCPIRRCTGLQRASSAGITSPVLITRSENEESDDDCFQVAQMSRAHSSCFCGQDFSCSSILWGSPVFRYEWHNMWLEEVAVRIKFHPPFPPPSESTTTCRDIA